LAESGSGCTLTLLEPELRRISLKSVPRFRLTPKRVFCMIAPGTNSVWATPLRSVLIGLGFFLLGSLSDFWLLRHIASLSTALVDDALVGIGAGLLVFLYMTERKQAEEAVSGMTRKWVEAQEQERSRIARELHDDISQRLALFTIELDQLRDEHNDLPPKVRDRVQELRNQTLEIATDVQSLSHELHSSKLDYLGVVRAMTSWCKEFGERQKLEIDFTSHDVRKVPQEISLCLFRVVQEAVHNAAKHSGVKRMEVQLAEHSSEIHLIVSDSGKGFDVETARQGRGLGLTSMRERVRAVGGTMAIESKPMAGTTIHVRVPLESIQRSKRVAVK
jgi:signal transduction histidine kinase